MTVVRKLLIIGIIIGAVLVIAGTVGALNFDPFRDDVVPTTVPIPIGTTVPIVGGTTVEGVVIGDTIDFVRMTCPEGFTSGAVNIETGLPICIQDTVEVITDPRTFECGENLQDDGMIIFVDCELILICFLLLFLMLLEFHQLLVMIVLIQNQCPLNYLEM